jgi:tRNA 2-selenouridine synthase
VSKTIAIEIFLASAINHLLIDVRTPAEFAKGHIRGAINIPLFDDAERVEIGTLYKQKSREEAILAGLDKVGPKMSLFIKQIQPLVKDNKVFVHCWRGGMRSGAMAWLFGLMGYEVYILKGGYKTYRRFVLDIFEKKYQLAVLGGKTGSGKTVILNELKSNGEQVVDLEKLAHHKGSAFGAIHELPQPTQEQFENDLALTLNDLDEKKMMWVEDESRGVGRCFIPKSFWIQLRLAPLFMIETNNEQRITQLVKDYSTFSVEQLEAPIRNIEKRLGNEQMNIALQALQERDFENVANMMLRYYDKAYNKCMTKKETNYIATIDYKQGSYESIANDLPLQYQLFLKKKNNDNE